MAGDTAGSVERRSVRKRQASCREPRRPIENPRKAWRNDLMMKLGCMSLSLRGSDANAFIDACRKLDLDMIEFHTSAFPDTKIETLRSVKKRCLQAGLPIGYLGISNDFGK